MRFQRLEIPAFGPFTDLKLAFPSGDHDFHLIYGPNEAGKSSLLRAIRDLLFGIPGQSPDDFIHEYKSLRLQAEVLNRTGVGLIFQRRKGNRNTLLDQDGNPLADTALQPFLGSVDPAYFSSMFGLGTSELREGAKQLLRGEGAVGNALFSASLGGTPIQRVLDSLVEESEGLFKGRATANVSIRPAVNRYKDLLRQSRDSMVHPDVWEKLEADLADKESAKERLEAEIVELDAEVNWISRCEDALPIVGRLREELRQLHELPELPELASDFVERSRTARTAVADARARVQSLAAEISRLEEQLTGCAISSDVLSEAEAIDLLHQDLGAYRTRKDHLSDLRSKLAGIDPALRAGMKNLELLGEPECLESFRVTSAVWVACEEAAEALEQALKEQSQNQDKADAFGQEIETLEHELRSLPELDLEPLRRALAVAASATESDQTLGVSQAEVKKLTRQVRSQQALVEGLPEELDTAAQLCVPAPATIRGFRAEIDEAIRDINHAEKQIREEEVSLGNLRSELSRLERRSELPSEEALREARSHRDHGWQLVLQDWKGDGAREELDPGSPLQEAFPSAIRKADDIADRLRLHADAVAQAEEKRLQLKTGQDQISQGKLTLEGLQKQLEERRAGWAAAWAPSGIQPRSPHEMEEWRENWVRFRDTVEKLRQAEANLQSRSQQVQQARETLAAALGESAVDTFPVLYEAARKRVAEGEALTGQWAEKAKQLQVVKTKMQTLEQKKAGCLKAAGSAERDWKSQCLCVGLPENTTPGGGLHLLGERKELLAKFDRWQESSSESIKVAEALQQYEQRIAAMAGLLGIQADTTEAQESGLWKALTAARQAQTRHDQLAAQVQDRRSTLEIATQTESQSVQALEDLVRLAKLGSVDELEPLLANLEKGDTLRSQIRGFRELLGGLARSQALDDFIAKVHAENPDELPARREQLAAGKATKQAALQDLQGALADLKKQKAELEQAGDAAADFQQQAESVAARLRQDAARFVRLKLASQFLRTQIERFREANQGPLLERSGQVFRQITGGAFDGLGAEFTDQDVPILVGRRPDGTNVLVEGMSDGTRDQLYLALRLAALDRYLEDHEPMPLILDDLLITFDDDRAKAIFAQLADMARRTQVFLFTHHNHIVRLCQEALGEKRFNLHRLTPSPFVSDAGRGAAYHIRHEVM